MPVPDPLRRRPDPRGRGRRSRLERTLLQVHATVLLVFCVSTLAPLLRSEGPTAAEAVLRLALTVGYLLLVHDLLRHGERVGHLGLLAVLLGLAVQLDRWPVAGDVSASLTLSAFAISSARLLRITPFALTLVASGTAYAVARSVVGQGAMPPGEVIDTVLLTAALTTSVAFFVNSLEDRTDTAEHLDTEAMAREAELHRQQSQELAATAAGRVLHDDVLTALRLVGDGGHGLLPEQVRRTCRDSVAAVRQVTGS